MKRILALILILFSTPIAAQPADSSIRAEAACDRECLRGTITEVLWALAENNMESLQVAATLRVTEDGVEKPLSETGLARSVTELSGYRQDIIDEQAGEAVAGVMVEESGAPAILVVRVKVDDEQKLSELELVTTRSRADGMLFAIDAYDGAPAREMNYVPRREQLESREDAIEIAMLYPRGLTNAETFNAVGTPFSRDAYRLENGRLMAGPECTFIPGCDDIGNQSLAVFNMLGAVTVRDVVVDERMGIVIMRLSWNLSGGEDPDKLTAWEMFKIYDGQIHMVHAYMRVFPPELELGGWPIDAGLSQP
ncbi:hypothetical protein [Aurantiacibacter hainanensis]|uniref:hypothetical protein n=1 Tax=Aurantiacibacter hainanensis TaxID=3076114 RepID=UPI0030C74D77